MMHITPYACTEGLFVNSGKLLKPNGLLFTYGPYAINGSITPESNKRFDAMLRHENLEFGLRDLQGQLIPLAARNGLSLVETIDLPANNKLLVWKNGPV
nr:unnamed protein product [Timema cristinae]